MAQPRKRSTTGQRRVAGAIAGLVAPAALVAEDRGGARFDFFAAFAMRGARLEGDAGLAINDPASQW